MAASPIPAAGITLGAPGQLDDLPKPNLSSAISLRLDEDVVRDIKKASKEKNGLQFVTGRFPKLRIGHTTIDLSVSPDTFRNELYTSSTTGSPVNFTFNNIVSHRAELKHTDRKDSTDTSGSDAALAALQSSLATYEQEKQAKATNITDSVLAIPKNRFEAARKQKQDARRGRYSSTSPHPGATPTHPLGPGPTSAPAYEGGARLQAMKTPMVHLLAMKPLSMDEIMHKTHIPKNDLDTLLQKIGKQVDGKWQLTDRAYKDLDVWSFEYKLSDDRQLAIDNAIRAYDRLRLGKDEAIWQQLLPKKERGKGVVLSRLNLAAGQASRGLTPHHLPSPTPNTEVDSKANSAVNTPRLGATPKVAPKGGDIMKRLLSKDPKKARAQEDAKEKKRKERDTGRDASDMEGSRTTAKRQLTKKAATATANTKYKSAELVHSSDDESGDEGEVREPIKRTDSKVDIAKSVSALKARPTPRSANSEDNMKVKRPKKPVAASSTKGSAAPNDKASRLSTAGKRTPLNTKGISAPTSGQKTQLSPQKPLSRPNVPSPLGAARPRVSSDVSDQSAIGIQSNRARVGVDTPKGLGISNGARKRQDTVTSTDSVISSGSDQSRTETRKPTTNGIRAPRASLPNGTGSKPEQRMKRKSDFPSTLNEQASKYRKTDSMARHSTSSSSGPPHGSPDAIFDSSDSAGSIVDPLTYHQGVRLAEKFRDQYYPRYAKMYDEQAAKQMRGQAVTKAERESLLNMHRQLEEMKRDINRAAQRQGRD